MKHTTLPSGTHGSLTITEPTRVKAVKRWDAKIVTPEHFGLSARADVEVHGVQFAYSASCGIRADMKINPDICLRDVWVRSSPVGGVLSYGKVCARKVLCEMNGLNPQKEHGFYLAGEFHLRQCISWFNSGFQVHLYNEKDREAVRGTIDRCLIVGPRAIAICSPHVKITNSTIIGEIYTSNGGVAPVNGKDGNLVLDYEGWHPQWHHFADARFRFFFLRAGTQNAGGCYSYDKRATKKWAMDQWKGPMTSRHGRTFRPWWPGDTFDEYMESLN